MRVAVLADIHGNLVALEAVLEVLPRLRVDRVVIGGDVVNGAPDSLACWHRVLALGCPIIRGNHERYVYDLGTEQGRPEWLTPQFAPVQFTARQLGDTVRAELARLPTSWTSEDCPGLLVVHASPRNDQDNLFPYTPSDEVEAAFGGAPQPWIVRGHNHYAGVRLWRSGGIVNTGSVGLPLDGYPRAQFVILERTATGWRPEHHTIPYDLGRAVARFRETGYLDEAGPMAHLYLREVETATFHLVPFLRYHGALLARSPGLSLAEVWAAYQKRGYGAG